MHRHRTAAQSGFTLVELLLVLALGGTVLGVAGAILLANIRSTIALEQNQQALNELARVSAFIELEVGEAVAESSSRPAISRGFIPAPNSCNPSGTEVFTLNLPNPGGISRAIRYFTEPDDPTATLWRCGPPVNNNGSLNYSDSPISFPLGSPITISLSPPLADPGSAESITYTLSSQMPGLNEPRTLPATTVRVRSTLIP